MPVHRHVHAKRGSVYALTAELDAWVQSRRFPVGAAETAPGAAAMPQAQADDEPKKLPRIRPWLVVAAIACLGLAAVGWMVWRGRTKSTTHSGIRSLAVLPLRNLSGDPAQDYLADGMTEALIGRLSTIHNLRLISHTSVMRFRNPQTSVPEIARELGVDAVVEGSVMREGSRIRVTAQLIRGATDEHFWSETYDRELRDALTLESELAQSIAEKVEVSVTGEERERLTASRAVAPEVYESYLKGRYVLEMGNTRAELEQSLSDFQEAIDRDATFAPAYLGLARAYTELGTVYGGVSPSETRPKVVFFARKALALDPNLIRAHVVLASVLQQEWQWTEAEAEYRRALALNPNAADAHAGYALWLICQGRSEEAVSWIERARELDPVVVSGGSVSGILFHARHYEEAIRESRSALALRPNDASALFYLGFALIANNQAADAVPVLKKAATLSKGSPAIIGLLIRAEAHAGQRGDALRLLEELKTRSRSGYIPTAAFVNAYLGLGDNEQAFHWLEQAYKEQSNILQFLKTHPYFDPIRNDPRFADLVRRVGLG